MVCRGYRVRQVDKPLEHSSEVSLVRHVDGDVVEAAVSPQVRCSRAAMQDKERLVGSTDLDAATITCAPLETGKLLPKARRPFWVSDLKMNGTKGDEILIYHIVSKWLVFEKLWHSAVNGSAITAMCIRAIVTRAFFLNPIIILPVVFGAVLLLL